MCGFYTKLNICVSFTQSQIPYDLGGLKKKNKKKKNKKKIKNIKIIYSMFGFTVKQIHDVLVF